MTLDRLIDEMLEFGVPLDVALKMAAALLPFFDDQGRLREAAIAQACPDLGERLGLMRIH